MICLLVIFLLSKGFSYLVFLEQLGKRNGQIIFFPWIFMRQFVKLWGGIDTKSQNFKFCVNTYTNI